MAKTNRSRRQITVTLSKQVLDVLEVLNPPNKSAFVQECIECYLTGEHMGFVTNKYGLVYVKGWRHTFSIETAEGEVLENGIWSLYEALRWLCWEFPELHLKV